MNKTNEIDFNGDKTLFVIYSTEFYIVMASLVPNLRLSWSGQRRKIVGERLNIYGYKYLYIESCRGIRYVICVPLKNINLFLKSINLNRLTMEGIKKVETYISGFYTFTSLIKFKMFQHIVV